MRLQRNDVITGQEVLVECECINPETEKDRGKKEGRKG
jgi:hypothetical protein